MIPLLLATALATEPVSLDDAAVAVTLGVPGNWRVLSLPDDRRPREDVRGPAPTSWDLRRLEPIAEHVHWSQPRLLRFVFSTDDDAEQHLTQWGAWATDDDPMVFATKSWHHRVRHGAIVWELWAPCASGEPLVEALFAALDTAVEPEGTVVDCACGGHCAVATTAP